MQGGSVPLILHIVGVQQRVVGPAGLAWVEAPPAFDSLGLDVEYRGSVHLVLGILAPEDILE